MQQDSTLMKEAHSSMASGSDAPAVSSVVDANSTGGAHHQGNEVVSQTANSNSQQADTSVSQHGKMQPRAPSIPSVLCTPSPACSAEPIVTRP